ncbi:hypothetical protein N9L68_01755 [bacterium]|nr:hypothetical protein [bacterium]
MNESLFAIPGGRKIKSEHDSASIIASDDDDVDETATAMMSSSRYSHVFFE